MQRLLFWILDPHLLQDLIRGLSRPSMWFGASSAPKQGAEAKSFTSVGLCNGLRGWRTRLRGGRGVDGRDNPRIKSGDGHDDGGSTRNGNEFATARIARTGGHIPLATQNANACES